MSRPAVPAAFDPAALIGREAKVIYTAPVTDVDAIDEFITFKNKPRRISAMMTAVSMPIQVKRVDPIPSR